MIFKFVVKYLSFFKYLPLVAWIFDAMMLLWNYFFNPDLQNAIEKVEAQATAWPGIYTTIHKFGGVQFNLNRKEIGHIHSNGILDILFSKKIKAELIHKGRVSDHHIFKNSGWISFYIKSQSDLEEALSLLRLSYDNKGELSHLQ